ncbi:hypothetical protein NOS3756_55750 (plasmid) [Nostoc sp. NIES-3756]|uniref:hypothetical protein n=1 Tax=Nostoc sp. NIES-3756 TaxID=1751286 RepID=UPI000722B6CD|nr:hypothetical protein [Nostoc sp. NIES-3756]BAT56563.1 hypothetical protein NOS3756_55750 [Nostoc sp. NIES-3756]
MVQSITAMEMATLDQISLYLLQDEEFGLKSVVANEEEAQLVNEAISLVGNYDRNVWTRLKQKALVLVGSPISDVVSRIASAYRSPDVALSCIRDASERSIEIAGDTARKKLAAQLRQKFRSFNIVQ